MKKTFSNFAVLLLVGASLMVSYGCPDETVFPAPAPPVFALRSSDTATVPTGIRSVYGEKAIHLEWFRNREFNLGGYRIYRTSQIIDNRPVNFRLYKDIPLRSQDPDTAFDDFGVVIDTLYHYRLKAYNTEDIESSFSDSIAQYKLALAPFALLPSGGVVSVLSLDDLTLSWNTSNIGGGTGYSAVHLYEDNDGSDALDSCAFIAYEQYGGSFGGEVSQTYSAIKTNSNTRLFKPLVSGKVYEWFVTTLPNGADYSTPHAATSRIERFTLQQTTLRPAVQQSARRTSSSRPKK